MPAPENPIRMAVIGAAHGVRGELRVKTHTGDPMALGDYGPLHTEEGLALEIVDIRPAGTVVVVRFKGVTTREQAEALTGTELFVGRAALPDDVEEGEFYHADLIGLEVRDETGNPIGKVAAVQNFGGGDILELSLGGRRDASIPFSQAAVPEVDLAGGFLRIDSVAAGLAGEDDPDAPKQAAPDAAARRKRGNRRRSSNPAGGRA